MNPFQSSENVFPHSWGKKIKIINTSRKGWVTKGEVYFPTAPWCGTFPNEEQLSVLHQTEKPHWNEAKGPVVKQGCDTKPPMSETCPNNPLVRGEQGKCK